MCLLTLLFGPLLQSWVGKLPEYPNPVASSISSRMMVELGMVTALMAAAAVLVGGFLASAVFAVTSFVFATISYVVWPIAKPFIQLFFGLIFGILERIWDNLVDFFSHGGIFSKVYEFYTFGGVSSSLEMLKPITLVLLTMVLLVRFTLSRRPKNFRKWVSFVLFMQFLALFTIHCLVAYAMDLRRRFILVFAGPLARH